MGCWSTMTSPVLDISGEPEASDPAQHPEVHQGRKQPVSPNMLIWMMCHWYHLNFLEGPRLFINCLFHNIRMASYQCRCDRSLHVVLWFAVICWAYLIHYSIQKSWDDKLHRAILCRDVPAVCLRNNQMIFVGTRHHGAIPYQWNLKVSRLGTSQNGCFENTQKEPKRYCFSPDLKDSPILQLVLGQILAGFTSLLMAPKF